MNQMNNSLTGHVPEWWKPTETKVFVNFHSPRNGPLVLEVQNDAVWFAWRLGYRDGEKGLVSTSYASIYEFDGWLMVTQYFDGLAGLKPFTPGRVRQSREVK